jgi:hypothetical protein
MGSHVLFFNNFIVIFCSPLLPILVTITKLTLNDLWKKQAVPSTMWYRLVGGINAQLWTVRQGSLRSTLLPLIAWLETHANPWLAEQDVRIDLAWCQATASGYYQLGLVLNDAEEVPQYFQPSDMLTLPRSPGRYVALFCP